MMTLIFDSIIVIVITQQSQNFPPSSPLSSTYFSLQFLYPIGIEMFGSLGSERHKVVKEIEKK